MEQLYGNKTLKKGRWYVRTIIDGEKVVIPLANYNWLSTNPAFDGIPKGYVIHHLDHDEMNDDPSNLAVMGKHQHRAYHLKTVNAGIHAKLNVEIQNDSVDNLISKKCTFGSISENTGKKGSKYIVRFKNIFRRFNDLEDAETFLNRLRVEASLVNKW